MSSSPHLSPFFIHLLRQVLIPRPGQEPAAGFCRGHGGVPGRDHDPDGARAARRELCAPKRAAAAVAAAGVGDARCGGREAVCAACDRCVGWLDWIGRCALSRCASLDVPGTWYISVPCAQVCRGRLYVARSSFYGVPSVPPILDFFSYFTPTLTDRNSTRRVHRAGDGERRADRGGRQGGAVRGDVSERDARGGQVSFRRAVCGQSADNLVGL